jgi:hypothetical protein
LQIAELQADKIELRSDKQQCIADKQQCNKQLDHNKDLYHTQNLQWTETCAAETAELRNNYEEKKLKIFELQSNLQQSAAQNIEKREEIKVLKEKIELLSEIKF